MIILLPNRLEVRTLHALKDRGLAISTLRFASGRTLNVAHNIERQQQISIDFWRRHTEKSR